jgi:fructose-1,6-bisphosphatase/inositol monophosphatase family enzyme
MSNQEIINFANHLADISGDVIKKYFRQDFGEITKDNETPVTITPDAKYQRVLDPIDGTISFVMGRPIFGTLIALCENGVPILGVINQPINGDRWLGTESRGLGELLGLENCATFNDKKMNVRKCSDLSEAILGSTSPHFFKGKDLETLNKISIQTKYQSQGGIIYGGDCYLFGLLAMGQIDIVIEQGLKNHDFAALVPVVKAAGGVITDWNGQELNLQSDGRVLACGDAQLHRNILEILNN